MNDQGPQHSEDDEGATHDQAARKQATSEPVRLWTAWGAYEGTGEGVTLLARIDHGESESQARDGFKETFGSFWPCTVQEGVVRNVMTQRLFAPDTLAWVESLERRAKVQLEARLHFRFS